MNTNFKTRRCAKCGAVMTGEFNQFSTCRNTEACKRRQDEAERRSERNREIAIEDRCGGFES